MNQYDIVVIGGGPAGLAAALSAYENGGKNILILERDQELGGILQQCIHNGFGLQYFKEELTGPEYAHRFVQSLLQKPIVVKTETMVLSITQEGEGSLIVRAMNTQEGILTIWAKAVILSMGCRERNRGALRIPGERPAGIMTAGTAQRLCNIEGYQIGRRIMILGSGDIGLIMARRLTLEGAKVLAVAELLPHSNGLTRNIVQCLEDYQIPIYYRHTVVDIEGSERVRAVTIAEVDGDFRRISGTEKRLECDTLLLSVGLIPENELSKEMGIVLDPLTGGPQVSESMETSIPGVFACGNVVHVHDLVDFVSWESEEAGKSAALYTRGRIDKGQNKIITKGLNGVNYIVPQVIHRENVKESLTLKLRVNHVVKYGSLLIRGDKEILQEVKKRHLAPGEMVSIVVDGHMFTDHCFQTLTIELKEGGED